jgi:RNA polymerase sigma factor (sigma-70 family)
MLNCAKKLVNETDAKDIVHKIVLKLMKNSDWVEKIILIIDNPKEIKSALYVIVCNECKDYHRHNKSRNKIFLDMPDCEIENIADHEQQQNVNKLSIIMFFLNKLNELNRDIFIKYHVENYSKEELAEEFNLSLRAIDSRLYRTLKEIRNKWGKKMGKKNVE